MKIVKRAIALRALAIALAVSLGAHAAEGRASHGSGGGGGDTGFIFLDIFLDLISLGVEVAAFDSTLAGAPPPPEGAQPPRSEGYQQQSISDDDTPPPYRRGNRRPFQSREGLLLSLGVGGGSMYISNQSAARTGAFDLDLRLGYGFSDRFQFFMDVDLGTGSYPNGIYGSADLATWAFTLRGQTVLVGDREGNGLNVNFGVGLGGVTRNSGYPDQASSAAGLALAGGLSYDARITPWFSLSPELFYTWHQTPADVGGHDVASIYGLRLNFLWYLH